MSVLSRLLVLVVAAGRRSGRPAAPLIAADGCNASETSSVVFECDVIEAPSDDWFSSVDVLAPVVAPWLADLSSAVVPELVIRIPLEGVPRLRFEDGFGRQIVPDGRMVDWLLSARSLGTLYVNAGNVAEAFELLDRERLEGRPPGRLFQGEGSL